MCCLCLCMRCVLHVLLISCFVSVWLFFGFVCFAYLLFYFCLFVSEFCLFFILFALFMLAYCLYFVYVDYLLLCFVCLRCVSFVVRMCVLVLCV